MFIILMVMMSHMFIHMSKLSLYALNMYTLLCANYTSKNPLRASLVAQWLRIRLPMQGIQVRALVWEDPTCRGATKPVRHNY